jgi:hypothetical protein
MIKFMSPCILLEKVSLQKKFVFTRKLNFKFLEQLLIFVWRSKDIIILEFADKKLYPRKNTSYIPIY